MSHVFFCDPRQCARELRIRLKPLPKKRRQLLRLRRRERKAAKALMADIASQQVDYIVDQATGVPFTVRTTKTETKTTVTFEVCIGAVY